MTEQQNSEKVKAKFNLNVVNWYLERGFRFVRLIGKNPADSGRRTFIKTAGSAKQAVFHGYNLGAEIPPGILVLDVDPRNGGDESLRRLLDDYFPGSQLPDLLALSYAVQTGGGGLHLYFRYDSGKPRGALKGYGGIDVKTPGGYVLIPGSVHPTTETYYEALPASPREIAPLPTELDELVLRKLRDPLGGAQTAPQETTHPLWGVVDARGLATLLAPLDASDYRDYNSQWFPLLCAAHHATAGSPTAAQIFGDWSAQDPVYANQAHNAVEKKWDTAHEHRHGSDDELATVRTILAEVHRANKLRELLGGPDDRDEQLAEKMAAALDAAKSLQDQIAIASLQIIEDQSDDVQNFVDWIDALKPDWQENKKTLPELIVKASHLPQLDWPRISQALAKKTDGKYTRAQLQRQIRKQATDREKEESKNNKMTHARIVDIAAQRALKSLVRSPKHLQYPPNEQFYSYQSGYWSPRPTSAITKACYEELERFIDFDLSGLRPLPQYARDATAAISLKRSTESTDLYSRKELPSCVNLTNGTLWLDDESGQIELKAHRKRDNLTVQLPYEYDNEATCPDFDTMLVQVFQHVADDYSIVERDDLIRHFWELIGYMIQPRKDLPKILVWVGEGQNGKSRIAQIISKLVGPAWLSVDMRSFFSRNQPHNSAALEGRLVLVDDDLKSGAVLDDGDLKKICQSKPLQVNPKNKPPYDIFLQLLPLIITNNRVQLDDTSRGAYRRLDVIEWNTDISHLQNSPLPDRVEETQMPGVLNRAIEGLSRLRARGDFQLPRCIEDYRARFVVSSNSALSFWESLSKIGIEGHRVPTSHLYAQYCHAMAEDGNGRPMKKDLFIDAIRRQGVTINREYLAGWVVSDFLS